ncbi:hypothetical protein C4K19_2534 [Pseudomonas chlororaphis subsp. aurantiaca]|nr:hypothetical protein C4K19_2534 [Pseudomonas chlororaphis subsp. aurantiaca]
MTCSRCRRLRSRPKGAQGLKIAEGLRPYRSLRQRLQDCCVVCRSEACPRWRLTMTRIS